MMPQGMSEWKLERFRLGELPEDEMKAIRQAMARDADLKARIEALDVSDKEIYESYPVAWMSRRIEQRAGQETEEDLEESATWFGSGLTVNGRSGSATWFRPGLALAAVLLLGVVVSMWLPGPEAPAPWDQAGMEVIRIKGDARLMLYRKNGSDFEQLADSSRAQAGDVIEIFYLAAGKSHGVIVSVDGNGVVTQHFPDSGTQAAQLKQGDSVSLGFAYELDDAPKWERFYFVTAHETFDLDAVKNVVKDSPDTLNIKSGLDQFVMTLYKGDK